MCCALVGVPDLPDSLTTSVAERTAGLPFAVEELLALLRDTETDVAEWDRAVTNAVPRRP